MIHNSPITNVNNEVIGYISVGSDITLMKEQQRKAQQQKKLAIIGQMGSGIVHETKNHLASIKGYCQLISLKSAMKGVKTNFTLSAVEKNIRADKSQLKQVIAWSKRLLQNNRRTRWKRQSSE